MSEMYEKQIFDKEKKYCMHKTHRCYLPLFENYNYCYRHILEDRNASFRQCSFIYSVNKRCNLPAPKLDRKESISFCKKHADIVHLTERKALLPSNPKETPEKLFSTLAHYATASSITNDGTKETDTFRNIVNTAKQNMLENSVLNCHYDSDNDLEDPKLSEVWDDAENDTSDTDNNESEPEDYLKNVGTYSAEEILQLTRSKLIRLEKLYMEQFKYYQYFLREKRRKYLHSLKKEKEIYSNIHDQPNNDPKVYEELKLLNQYQKNNGIDAILAKKVRENRLKITPGLSNKNGGVYAKCIFADDGVKCSERQLPTSKYCRKHILKDNLQVLYRACGAKPADSKCEIPVLEIFPETTCVFHKKLPEMHSYRKVKKDDDSDIDDSMLTDLEKSIKTDNSPSITVDENCAEESSSNTEELSNQPKLYYPTAEEKRHALELITLKHLLGESVH